MWLIVGISGATCSGKTTLARMLCNSFPNSHYVCQDDFFYPKGSQYHTYIPELNCYNWDITSSLDMEGMTSIVNSMLSRPSPHTSYQILVLEGFLLLNYKPVADLCHLKYYVTLDREESEKRRKKRVYDPPDCPGYFEKVVWPEYERHRDEILKMSDVKILDGSCSNETLFELIKSEVIQNLEKLNININN